jgi:LacI family transcriptional regulator
VVGITDVARAAGVSVGTVSNVLNRPELVSPARRELVEATIERLGYVRNESARQLRAGTSRTIALVVVDVANPFFADVIAGVEEAADEVGALVVVSNSGGSVDREGRHLTRLKAQQVMGVLFSPIRDDLPEAAEELERAGTPVVVVDGTAATLSTPSVAVDDVEGGRLAAEHLLARGHRSLVYVGGPHELRQVRDRERGFTEEVDRHPGTRAHSLSFDDLDVRAGSRAAAQLFATWTGPGERPTAVFCANDLLALGVLNECLRRGVRVPHELAIVGYDDITYAGTAAVPLTSVRQPREQLGRAAVELLLNEVAAAPEVTTPRLFTPELVVRESS